MTELIGHIANVVLPIALCVLTGYGLAVLLQQCHLQASPGSDK